MKTFKCLVAVAVILSVCSLAAAESHSSTVTITTSGGSGNIQGPGNSGTFEEVISGSPSTVSIVLKGCMQAGTCQTLETNTATTAQQIRTPTISSPFLYFFVVASWTGGTNVSITVNATVTVAGTGGTGSGGGATSCSGLSDAAPSCSIDATLVANVVGAAPLTSPALLGSPTTPNQTALSNNTLIANTHYADAAVGVETTRATAAEALAIPKTTTVNGHALSSNVSVTAADLNAPVLNAANHFTGSPNQIDTLLAGTGFSDDGSTAVNSLAKFSGTTLVAVTTSDTKVPVHLVTNIVSSKDFVVSPGSEASCIFDGATTAQDYVVVSTTTGKQCHDAGASYPTDGTFVLGRVKSTNAAGGTFAITWLPFFGVPSTGMSTSSANVMTSSGKIDMHSSPVADGFKPPAGAGANPTADGACAWDTTNHKIQCGDGTNTRSGTEQPLIAGVAASTCAASSTCFGPIVGSSTVQTTENLRQENLPFDGVIRDLCIRTLSTQPSTGSLTIVLHDSTLNADVAGLSRVIAANSAAGLYCDTTNNSAVVANHDYTWKFTEGVTNASATMLTVSAVYRY